MGGAVPSLPAETAWSRTQRGGWATRRIADSADDADLIWVRDNYERFYGQRENWASVRYDILGFRATTYLQVALMGGRAYASGSHWNEAWKTRGEGALVMKDQTNIDSKIRASRNLLTVTLLPADTGLFVEGMRFVRSFDENGGGVVSIARKLWDAVGADMYNHLVKTAAAVTAPTYDSWSNAVRALFDRTDTLSGVLIGRLLPAWVTGGFSVIRNASAKSAAIGGVAFVSAVAGILRLGQYVQKGSWDLVIQLGGLFVLTRLSAQLLTPMVAASAFFTQVVSSVLPVDGILRSIGRWVSNRREHIETTRYGQRQRTPELDPSRLFGNRIYHIISRFLARAVAWLGNEKKTYIEAFLHRIIYGTVRFLWDTLVGPWLQLAWKRDPGVLQLDHIFVTSAPNSVEVNGIFTPSDKDHREAKNSAWRLLAAGLPQKSTRVRRFDFIRATTMESAPWQVQLSTWYRSWRRLANMGGLIAHTNNNVPALLAMRYVIGREMITKSDGPQCLHYPGNVVQWLQDNAADAATAGLERLYTEASDRVWCTPLLRAEADARTYYSTLTTATAKKHANALVSFLDVMQHCLLLNTKRASDRYFLFTPNLLEQAVNLAPELLAPKLLALKYAGVTHFFVHLSNTVPTEWGLLRKGSAAPDGSDEPRYLVLCMARCRGMAVPAGDILQINAEQAIDSAMGNPPDDLHDAAIARIIGDFLSHLCDFFGWTLVVHAVPEVNEPSRTPPVDFYVRFLRPLTERAKNQFFTGANAINSAPREFKAGGATRWTYERAPLPEREGLL